MPLACDVMIGHRLTATSTLTATFNPGGDAEPSKQRSGARRDRRVLRQLQRFTGRRARRPRGASSRSVSELAQDTSRTDGSYRIDGE